MKYLLLNQTFYPDVMATGQYLTEVAVRLIERGHQVTVVTGAPSYPYGRVFPGYRNSLYQVEWLDEVRVIRTWSFISPARTFWPRIWHYGTYSATAFWGVPALRDVLQIKRFCAETL